MKIENEIRKKTMISTLVGFAVLTFVFLVLNLAGLNSTTVKQAIMGFKEKEVKNLDTSISKYNSSLIYANELVDMNVQYEEKIDKKIIATKLFLAKTDFGIIYFIPNPQNSMEKVGDKYLIRGSFEPISQDFSMNYSIKAYEILADTSTQPYMVLNELSPWKFDMKIILAVIGVMSTMALIFLLNGFMTLINVKNSKSYRNLKDYGNPKKLIKVIENELEGCESLPDETKNWYIFKGFYTILFIPKEFVIATASIRDGKRGSYMIIYEFTGESKKLALSNDNLITMQNLVHSRIPNVDFNTNKDISIFGELRVLASEVWEEYKNRRNNLFFDIIEGNEEEQILKFRGKFINIVKELGI